MSRPLTARQREVLLLVANGHSSAAIAALLWISKETVSTILGTAYKNLCVHDRAHAVAVCLRRGEFSTSDIALPDLEDTA